MGLAKPKDIPIVDEDAKASVEAVQTAETEVKTEG